MAIFHIFKYKNVDEVITNDPSFVGYIALFMSFGLGERLVDEDVIEILHLDSYHLEQMYEQFYFSMLYGCWSCDTKWARQPFRVTNLASHPSPKACTIV